MVHSPGCVGVGLVEGVEGGGGWFELPRVFEADGAVAARQREDLSALDHRLPTEAGERHQQVVDATGFVVAGRAVVGGAIDEFLMLGADAPAVPGLFALDHGRRELVAVFDAGVVAVCGGARAHFPPLNFSVYNAIGDLSPLTHLTL